MSSIPPSEDAVFMACAHAAHEVNRAYCAALGDTSQAEWHSAPEWQRKSALIGVHGVLIVGNNPKESHQTWLAAKRADGWVFGEIKNPETKEHPCMVEYEQLPEAQRQKDDLFVTTVRIMAANLNWTAPNTYARRLEGDPQMNALRTLVGMDPK